MSLRTGLRLAGRHDELLALALRIETRARALNGVGSGETVPEPDLVEVLHAACTLLERTPMAQAEPQPPACRCAEHAAGGPADDPLSHAIYEYPDVEPGPQPPIVRTPAPGPATAREPVTPPRGVLELIALRDQVSIAAKGDPAAAPAALASLFRQLAGVLERAGVRVLESEGEPLDLTLQEALDTRPTSERGEDEVVCATIRAGYAVGDLLIRPQQVVVYRFGG